MNWTDWSLSPDGAPDTGSPRSQRLSKGFQPSINLSGRNGEMPNAISAKAVIAATASS